MASKARLSFSSPASRKRFFDNFAAERKFKSYEDWYTISFEDIKENGGKSLLVNYYSGSLPKALEETYPEHALKRWKFEHWRKSKLFWDDASNHRLFLDDLGNKLKISTHEDWYEVSRADLLKNGGRPLLQLHKDNMATLIPNVYKEYEWKPWKFERVPSSFWTDKKNHRMYLDSVAKQLGISTWKDWYKIRRNSIEENGGSSILQYHHDSYIKTLTEVYPEHPWRLWKFVQGFSPSLWDDKANVALFLKELAEELRIEKMEDWYKVTREVIEDGGGKGLLERYEYSTANLIMSFYPYEKWKVWKFDKVPSGYWIDKRHHREFLEHLGEVLGFKVWEDWYRVTRGDLINHGGARLLQLYSDSHQQVIMNVFSADYPFEFQRFVIREEGVYKDPILQRKFFDDLGKKLGIKSWQDWNRITTDQIYKNSGATILQYYGSSISKALETLYPEHPWAELRDSSSQIGVRDRVSKSQSHLLNMLIENVFPREYIHSNFRINDFEANDNEASKIELDVMIPTLKLAFEFQGEQHYLDFAIFQSGASTQIVRDERKKRVCERNGITLIEVPFWWDGSLYSLMATIAKYRPDLKTHLEKQGLTDSHKIIIEEVPPALVNKMVRYN